MAQEEASGRTKAFEAGLGARWRGALSKGAERLNQIPILNRCLVILIIIGLWANTAQSYPAYILPSPWAVVKTLFFSFFDDHRMLFHILSSLYRLVVGFAISAVAGVVLGFLMATAKTLENQLILVFRVIQPIPGIAWTGVMLIWFGVTDQGLIAVVIITILPVIVVSSFTGFSSIEADYIDAARTLGARTKYQLFRYVTLPAALPVVLNGLYLGFAFGWRVLVGAEMIGSISGLGYLIEFYRSALETSVVFGALIVLAILMYLFEEALYKPVQRRMLGGYAKV